MIETALNRKAFGDYRMNHWEAHSLPWLKRKSRRKERRWALHHTRRLIAEAFEDIEIEQQEFCDLMNDIYGDNYYDDYPEDINKYFYSFDEDYYYEEREYSYERDSNSFDYLDIDCF